MQRICSVLAWNTAYMMHEKRRKWGRRRGSEEVTQVSCRRAERSADLAGGHSAVQKHWTLCIGCEVEGRHQLGCRLVWEMKEAELEEVGFAETWRMKYVMIYWSDFHIHATRETDIRQDHFNRATERA